MSNSTSPDLSRPFIISFSATGVLMICILCLWYRQWAIFMQKPSYDTRMKNAADAPSVATDDSIA